MIVIASIQGHLLCPLGLAHCAHHVECLIPVERCYLDSSDIFVFCKPAPEIKAEYSSAYCRLQIKAKDRNDLRDRLEPFD